MESDLARTTCGPNLSFVPGRLFGRSSELTALRALFDDAFGRADAAAAIVLGEPGSGKSRLIAELPSLAGPDAVIEMAGFEPERDVAFAASHRLLGALRAAIPRAINPLEFEASRESTPVEPVRVFEAVHRALAGRGPTVLLVDDVHWVDGTSVALLHYVLRAAATSHQTLVVVLASRPSEVALSVTGSLRRVLDPGRLLEIELGPLEREDALRLARDLDPQVTEDRAIEAWTTSGGSPFWLHLLATSEHLELDAGRIVSDRLRPCGIDGETLLALLAVVARPIPIEDVMDVQAWRRSRVERALTALERAGLAVRQSGCVSVAHDLIQQTMLGTISAGRARRLHRDLGAWLQATAGNDEQGLLEALEHQHLAGGPSVELATRLVESSRRLEVGALARLASIADGVGPRTVGAQRLREGVASLASDLGQHEEALRRWSECASTEGHRYRSARASLRASEAALELARPREAWLHWHRARDGCSGDAVLEVETLAQEAAIYKFLEHQPQASRDAAERALAGARALALDTSGTDPSDLHRRRALLRALFIAAEVALLFGDPEEMLALAGELEMAASGFDDAVHIRALVEGAVALRFLGLNNDAEARLRQAWDTVHQKILPQRTLEVGAALGNVLVSMGRLQEADAILRDCVALGMRLEEFRPSRTFALVLPHQLELLRGDWRTAVDGLRAAAAVETDPHYRQSAHRERATVIARLDPSNGAEEVRDAVAEAMQDAQSAACVRCQAETFVRGAEALARIGDQAGARSLVARAEISPSDAHNGFWRQRALAAILSVSGAAADSVEALRAVIAEAERQRLHVEAVWAELDLGVVQIGYDRTGAIATLRHAGTAAEGMTATTAERAADQLLRTLGVRTWRRQASVSGDDPLATLTPREREIALLVSAGSTNPEIASAVFLSRKTVERHVSNIFAKLAVRNRAELAAAISQLHPSEKPAD